METGKVYITGAGPGDPGLITVKGLEAIKKADVIIYDYLASTALLSNVKQDTEIIYAGKKGGDHTMSQEDINALIIKKAMQGLSVARLKGGDPFIFGRGGEEAEALAEKGIEFEIIPGVTSAIAAPAYAGIPLTHRKFTATVAFATGHEDPLKESSNIDWKALASIGTVVFLMGVKNIVQLTDKLIQSGKPGSTPAAIVRRGTTPKQAIIEGTLETIAQKTQEAGLRPPAIIVVGETASLRQKMKWFESRPLFGKKIIVTRARKQASGFVKILSELGAACLECPTIQIEALKDLSRLNKAIEDIDTYDWVTFTSVNGVEFFFKRLFSLGKDVRALRDVKTAVIGPATESRLLEFGLKSDIVPETYRAESIIKAFADKNIKGKKVLLPRALGARPILPEELVKMGGIVDEIPTYAAKMVPESKELIKDLLEEKNIDIVTFTSSSTVRNFKSILPAGNLSDIMKHIKVASIGPVTTGTAEKLGFKVDITSKTYTIQGLADAIIENTR